MRNTGEDLRLALDRVLTGASFDLGRIVMERSEGTQWAYGNRPEERLDPEGFRRMCERARLGKDPIDRVRTPNPMVRMDQASRTALMETLRGVLSDYLNPDTDSVGHAFPMGGDRGSSSIAQPDGLRTEAQLSSVNQLADSLTRGAAAAGSDRIAELVAGWADGGSMTYRTCLVSPIATVRAVSPIDGVDFVPLPLSTEELPAGLPGRQVRSRADSGAIACSC